MGELKKTYIKLKFYPVYNTLYLYTAPSTVSTIQEIGGPNGVDWDHSSFTMTAGGSGVTDFTTLFDVGGLVINSGFNELWANVVSVTATEVVFDGDLSGYSGGKFIDTAFTQWTDPADAFKLVLNSTTIDDPSQYIEVNCWYPGDENLTACSHPAKVVSRDGYTLTLDRPIPLDDPLNHAPILWNGSYSGATTDSLLSVAFWGGEDYFYDAWFQFPANTLNHETGWLEFWDSFGASSSNQTEEQLYAIFDKQVNEFAKVLDASYPETDWYVGTPLLGEYFN